MKLPKSPRAITERSSNNHKEEENFSMKRNYLIFTVLLIAVLALTLSGCGREEISLDGLYVATFELEGGTLETPTSSVNTNINFAYHPNTYVLNPCELNGYNLTRMGYVFTGWYTDKSCSESSRWDFSSVINTERLTLYAGWKEAIKITYTVCYTDETGALVTLGQYDVLGGDRFDDWRNFAKKRSGYTPLGYYSDPECTVEWDVSFTHPGLDEDYDVPVYVDYMQGVWSFVDNLSELKDEISAGRNVYLTGNIDCGGATLSLGNYSGELNGNGFTISNFKVEKSGKFTVTCALFTRLGDGAVIRDVSFTDVVYDVMGVTKAFEFAALARTTDGAVTISGVTVSGNLITDFEGEIPDPNVLVQNPSAETVIDDRCSVNVTLNN
jgi:uncharacterized repeat protein (TIGR02543 family)